METKPTAWTGTKNLAGTAHLELGTFFWILIIILVLVLIAWRAGWFPAIKTAATKTFSESQLGAMFNR